MSKSKLPLLELIRGCAALLVFLSHISPKVLSSESRLSNIFNYGTEAVAVFFVLSGYVMSYALTSKPRTRRSFLFHRFIRIYPTYFLALTLSFLLLWDSEYSSRMLYNYLMLGSLGWDVVRLPINNLALWSITYEMIFYYLFAFCIVRKEISFNRIWLWTLCALFATVGVFTFKFDFGPFQLVQQAIAFSLSWLIGFWAHQKRTFLQSIPFPVKVCLFVSLLGVSRLPFAEIQSPLKFAFVALVVAPLLSIESGNPSSSKVRSFLWVSFAAILNFTVFAFSSATRANAILYLLASIILLVSFMALRFTEEQVQNLLKKFNWVIMPMGRVSYALYVLHTPLMHLFFGLGCGTVVSTVGTCALLIPVIYIVEYHWQPKIAAWLKNKSLSLSV